jgi:hypothetical protein
MISGVFVLNGKRERSVRPAWKLLTTTRGNTMARVEIHPGEHLAEELKELKMSAAPKPF